MAARDAAAANVAALNRQREDLQTKSPREGIVDALDLQPGDLVAPGAPDRSMLDDSRLRVRPGEPVPFERWTVVSSNR